MSKPHTGPTTADVKYQHRMMLARLARNTAADHRAAAVAAKTRGLGQAFADHFTTEAKLLESLAGVIEDCCAEASRTGAA